jgi:hypothetical protein
VLEFPKLLFCRGRRPYPEADIWPPLFDAPHVLTDGRDRPPTEIRGDELHQRRKGVTGVGRPIAATVRFLSVKGGPCGGMGTFTAPRRGGLKPTRSYGGPRVRIHFPPAGSLSRTCSAGRSPPATSSGESAVPALSSQAPSPGSSAPFSIDHILAFHSANRTFQLCGLRASRRAAAIDIAVSQLTLYFPKALLRWGTSAKGERPACQSHSRHLRKQ